MNNLFGREELNKNRFFKKFSLVIVRSKLLTKKKSLNKNKHKLHNREKNKKFSK